MHNLFYRDALASMEPVASGDISTRQVKSLSSDSLEKPEFLQKDWLLCYSMTRIEKCPSGDISTRKVKPLSGKGFPGLGFLQNDFCRRY